MATPKPKLKTIAPKFTISKTTAENFRLPSEHKSVVSKINEVIKEEYNNRTEHLNFKDLTNNIREKHSKTLFRSKALVQADRPLDAKERLEHHLLEHLNVLYHSILINYKKISTQHINV